MRRGAGTRRGRRLRALVVGLGLLLAHAPRAEASVLDLFGFGATSPATAGTGVASAEDYDAAYLNPAGLSAAPRKRLSLGLQRAAFRLDGGDRPSDDAWGVTIGGVVPLPLGGGLRDRVALGLGFFVPTDVVTRAQVPWPDEARYGLLGNRAKVVGVQLAVGVRAGAHWALGVGFLALATLEGRISLSANPAGGITSRSEQELLTQFAPIVGARGRLAPAWRWGAVLRLVSRSSFDVRVDNDLAGALPLTLPPLQVSGVAQYDPLTVAGEVTWRAAPRLELATQVAFQRWSAFPAPTDNPVTGQPALTPPGFHDIFVPRLGATWLVARRLVWRGGVAFVPTPAPAHSGAHFLIDAHRVVLGTGLGVGLPWDGVPVRLDLWAQLHALVPRDVTGPAGDTARAAGLVWAAGLGVGVDL